MEGIDLAPSLALVLLAHLCGPGEQRNEDGFESAIAVDLAGDIADQAPQPGAQELELAPGPLELMGMGVATHHDGSPLGDPQRTKNTQRSQNFATMAASAATNSSPLVAA